MILGHKSSAFSAGNRVYALWVLDTELFQVQKPRPIETKLLTCSHGDSAKSREQNTPVLTGA